MAVLNLTSNKDIRDNNLEEIWEVVCKMNQIEILELNLKNILMRNLSNFLKNVKILVLTYCKLILMMIM